MGEYLYACKNASCLRPIRNVRELKALLKQQTSVKRLVFLLHSAPGAIILDGQYLDLDRLASDLKGTPFRVTEEIVFDGCNVGTQGPAVVAFMQVLKAPKAVGYSAYHAYAHVEIKIPEGGVEPSALERMAPLPLIREYLLPGQPSLKEIAKREGTRRLYYEFFTRDSDPGPIIAERDKHSKKPRSELVERVFTPETAKEAAELDTPAGPMYRIVFKAAAK